MRNQQVTSKGIGPIQPTPPRFPPPLAGGSKQIALLPAAIGNQNAMSAQEWPVLAESLLDVAGGRFVHADVQHNSPSLCRLISHHHLRRACIVTDQHSLSVLARLTIAS